MGIECIQRIWTTNNLQQVLFSKEVKSTKLIPSLGMIVTDSFLIPPNDDNSKLEEIQYNLTNKLIRTFLRLGCHYNNINITSFPYELDSALHVEVDETKDIVCNNKLLYETGSNVYEKVSFGHKEHKKR